MIALLLGILGLCLGSFVNAFVWRLHEGKDWVRGRSQCPHCGHILAPKDLVPVISWLYLRGKCRYCHARIPDTPLAELLVPTLFLLSYYLWPWPLHGVHLLQFILWLPLLVAFTALALYDAKWFLLPDKITYPLMGVAAVWVLASWLGFHGSFHAVWVAACSAGLLSGLFYLLHHASKGSWIGFGDVKLAVTLGLLAGGLAQVCLLLFTASLLGVLISLPLVATGRATRKTHLPFGPLLLVGMFVVQLFGNEVVALYSRLLGM